MGNESSSPATIDQIINNINSSKVDNMGNNDSKPQQNGQQAAMLTSRSVQSPKPGKRRSQFFGSGAEKEDQLRSSTSTSQKPGHGDCDIRVGSPIRRPLVSKFEPGGEKGSRAADWLSQTPPAVCRSSRRSSLGPGSGDRSGMLTLSEMLTPTSADEPISHIRRISSMREARLSSAEEDFAERFGAPKAKENESKITTADNTDEEESPGADFSPLASLWRLKNKWSSSRMKLESRDSEIGDAILQRTNSEIAEIDNILQKAREQKASLALLGHDQQSVRLGGWQRGKLLGRGVLGPVFVARNEQGGDLIAVRVIRATKSRTTNDLREIQLYIDNLTRIRHPNVVGYLGAELTGDVLFIHEEYVPGGSLHELLESFPGKQSELILSTYASQILRGLAHLHENGVAHHDINPHNILIGDGGQLRLHDYGLFSFIRSFKEEVKGPFYKEHRKASCNPALMPSGLRMQMGSGKCADVWGIGCTLVHLLTGQPPWDVIEVVEDNVADLKIVNANDPPAIPKGISDSFKDFLALCFHRDPAVRPNVQELLKHPFVKIKDIPTINEQTPPRTPLANEVESRPISAASTNSEAPLTGHSELYSPSHPLTPNARQNWDDVPVGGAAAEFERQREITQRRALQKERQQQNSAFHKEQYENKRLLLSAAATALFLLLQEPPINTSAELAIPTLFPGRSPVVRAVIQFHQQGSHPEDLLEAAEARQVDKGNG
eukprot:CAMPEP_0117764582 /NCGR_PEP_ID=MMETSP0947-20121206/19482_1 /TAXON_ID=44440 /ORGANISM="Chattonella subsalsa, Strain CCMP2191" /LENGTH=719 /DNA_ID=CAMNT_0005586833 /DNA_START=47 /DNA_END=2207 /DNA_ORIENTATION=-